MFLPPPQGGPRIALYPGRAQPPGGGAVLLALDVPDLEASAAALAARGVEVSEPRDVPGGRIVLFADPEGNRLELHEPR